MKPDAVYFDLELLMFDTAAASTTGTQGTPSLWIPARDALSHPNLTGFTILGDVADTEEIALSSATELRRVLLEGGREIEWISGTNTMPMSVTTEFEAYAVFDPATVQHAIHHIIHAWPRIKSDGRTSPHRSRFTTSRKEYWGAQRREEKRPVGKWGRRSRRHDIIWSMSCESHPPAIP